MAQFQFECKCAATTRIMPATSSRHQIVLTVSICTLTISAILLAGCSGILIQDNSVSQCYLFATEEEVSWSNRSSSYDNDKKGTCILSEASAIIAVICLIILFITELSRLMLNLPFEK